MGAVISSRLGTCKVVAGPSPSVARRAVRPRLDRGTQDGWSGASQQRGVDTHIVFIAGEDITRRRGRETEHSATSLSA